MELNKLENQFKEKLENREINPSEAAWDRLDAMLSVAESKPDSYLDESTQLNSNRKFTWLYVAAGILGFLFVGNLFFSQKESLIENQKNNIVIEKTSLKDTLKSETKPQTKELSFPKTSIKAASKALVQTAKIKKNSIENQVVNTPKEVVVESKPNYQNEAIVINKSSISTNIDSLLASVDKPNTEAKKAAIKINSTALLNQVDGELQVSFREKALNTITKKYKEAKEALANRNNQ
jgi:hypothetical protein